MGTDAVLGWGGKVGGRKEFCGAAVSKAGTGGKGKELQILPPPPRVTGTEIRII